MKEIKDPNIYQMFCPPVRLLVHHKKLQKAEAEYTYIQHLSSIIKKKKNKYMQQSVHRFPNFYSLFIYLGFYFHFFHFLIELSCKKGPCFLMQ